MKKLLILFIIIFSFQSFAQSRKNISDFVLKDVLESKDYSLSSFRNSTGIAVIFTSTDCPFAVYYDDRIKVLIDKYSSKGISFILINSNFGRPESAESLERLKIHARIFGVPYLADMAQDALSKFEARKNPEAFLIKHENGKYFVVYQGAIDDNPQVTKDVHTQYFDNALTQLLANKSITPSFINPSGCIIKKR